MPENDAHELTAWLDALPGAPVLVVGDVMLDTYITGTVTRVSPEAPVPVLHTQSETTMLGGAGNVLRNLADLGAAGVLVGVVGDDPDGAAIHAHCRETTGAEAPLVTAAGWRTTRKTRYIAGTQQLLRADAEDGGQLPENIRAAVRAAVESRVGACRAVVLSDYGKGVLDSGTLRHVIDAARAAGVPVVVDPKGRDVTRYAGAQVVTPNRPELQDMTGCAAEGDADVAAAARQLRQSGGLDAVLATRGAAGMTLVTADAAPVHLPAGAREVFDVSGAGDTVVAALAAGLAAGAPLPAAAELANAAAGVVVGKLGTATARPPEVLHALHAGRLLAGEAKLLDTAGAEARVAAWHRAGLQVGFTNGCFDLLHPGHVSLLRQARAACDRLVVGLNSDASVARLKGDGRPLQDAAARAAVLGAIDAVDAIVIFAEDTPRALIDRLAPEVLVKGGDYTPETVVGADLVTARGGRIVIADLAEGYSTTNTIRRLGG